MITYCRRQGYCYDVNAIYLNNKLVAQWNVYDELPDLQKVLKEIGTNGYGAGFCNVEIGAWIEEEGYCPETLEEFNILQLTCDT